MSYSKARYDLAAATRGNGPKTSDFGPDLGLKNLGVSIYVFERGEGFDFFHSHREQEEVYLCMGGSVDLRVAKATGQSFDANQFDNVHLEEGDIVRVDPDTMRAIGNTSSERGVVVIAGACPHPYPAGFGHHDVIADVLGQSAHGSSGFRWPSQLNRDDQAMTDEDC